MSQRPDDLARIETEEFIAAHARTKDGARRAEEAKEAVKEESTSIAEEASKADAAESAAVAESTT